jgi:phosphonate transport system substrate-binding protein
MRLDGRSRPAHVLGARGPLLLGLLGIALAFASDAVAQPNPARRLAFGVMTDREAEPDRVLRVFSDLVAVLRERLQPAGIQVPDIVIARDVEDLARRIAGGEVDFVIETVFPTLLLQARAQPLEPALVVIRRGRRAYRSVFFARKDGPIRSLADLEGRILVLQAERSTSAFALPRAELARNGIDLVAAGDAARPARVVRYVLADAEVNQAVWVLHGRGDAGAFNEADWEALPAGIRDQLQIFHETRPILRALLSFRAGLHVSVRREVEKLLVALPQDPEGKAALNRATGITAFEPLTARDREGLREWRAVLKPLASSRP